MQDRPTPWRILAVAASATACLLAAGCSSDTAADETEAVRFQPLDGVDSPEPGGPPSGTVTASRSGLHSTTFDATTRSVVALTDDAMSLAVYDADSLSPDPRAVTLPAAAADIVAVGDGTLLLPMQGRLARVDLRTDDLRVDELRIDGVQDDTALLSAAVLADGRVAVGDDGGSIHVIDPSTGGSQVIESETIDGLTSVDGLAATQFGLAALDRQQTSLTKINTDSDSPGAALRAGEGAAELDTDPYGRILVTDAAGGELLVFSSDDLLLRQRFPIDAQPWAVTYDDTSNVVWVSTPADNEVIGYTLNTGIPVEVGRFSTVRQPDSIAVDDRTSTLFVGSAAGGGLQRIPIDGVG